MDNVLAGGQKAGDVIGAERGDDAETQGPSIGPVWARATSSRFRAAARTSRPSARSRSPSGVGATWRRERSKSVTSSSCSSLRTCSDSPAWLTPQRSAAREKLRRSSTATTYSISRRKGRKGERSSCPIDMTEYPNGEVRFCLLRKNSVETGRLQRKAPRFLIGSRDIFISSIRFWRSVILTGTVSWPSLSVGHRVRNTTSTQGQETV